MQVRDAIPADAAPLALLINEIIRIGGTTAHQVPFTPESFAAHYFNGPRFLCCMVAVDAAGVQLGFQSGGRRPDLGPGWAEVGTFARAAPKTPGVGRALFAATRERFAALGITAIDATIRADNRPGLAYYDRMGFEDYGRLPDVPLHDGSRVDRVLKRYLLA